MRVILPFLKIIINDRERKKERKKEGRKGRREGGREGGENLDLPN